MISVLTLTYQRHHFLEEAIQSFLSQKVSVPTEMVVINDSPQVQYTIDHPSVKILNCPTRFSSINKKIEWGYKQCSYDWIYRLDDDDLLAPKALKIVVDDITNNPGYEIYRGHGMYFFGNNRYEGVHHNVNTGNVYSKKYFDRINFVDSSWGEDVNITFGFGGSNYGSKTTTMIYRWGMNIYHVSGFGSMPSSEILNRTDQSCGLKEHGVIHLNPHFKNDYYGQLPIEAQEEPQTNINQIQNISVICPLCNGTKKIKRTSVLKVQKIGSNNTIESTDETITNVNYVDCSLCKNK